MPTVLLGDGSPLRVSIHGQGSPLLMPCAHPVTGAHGSPHSTRSAELVSGLAHHAQVIAFDYGAHRLRYPRSTTLTLDTVAQDMLTIADAVGAETFSFLGHSWLALAGPHLAAVTGRVRGIAMGGLSPLDPPLAELLDLAMRNHRRSIAGDGPRAGTDWPASGRTAPGPWPVRQVSTERGNPLRPGQARQFVTFFDDAHGRPSLARAQILSLAIPRLCFVEQGAALRALTGHVLLDDHVLASRRALEQSGWRVTVLDRPPASRKAEIDATLEVLRHWLAWVSVDPQAGIRESVHTLPRPRPHPHRQPSGQVRRVTGGDRVEAHPGAWRGVHPGPDGRPRKAHICRKD